MPHNQAHLAETILETWDEGKNVPILIPTSTSQYLLGIGKFLVPTTIQLGRREMAAPSSPARACVWRLTFMAMSNCSSICASSIRV